MHLYQVVLLVGGTAFLYWFFLGDLRWRWRIWTVTLDVVNARAWKPGGQGPYDFNCRVCRYKCVGFFDPWRANDKGRSHYEEHRTRKAQR